VPEKDDDDPLMARIREAASLVCFAASGPIDVGEAGYTREQLVLILKFIRQQAGDILLRTGIGNPSDYMDRLSPALHEQLWRGQLTHLHDVFEPSWPDRAK
jgi:hypothetical protein